MTTHPEAASEAAGDAPGTPGTPAAQTHLAEWGWDDAWAAAFEAAAQPGQLPARVIAQHRGSWLLATEAGESHASATGRFRHQADKGDLPAVGDWVACVPSPHQGDSRIDAVLPRRSTFLRRAAGSRVAAQIVAANVDTLFVATSLNGDLNPRRLERYVAMGRESGAEPVVLLTKADLVEDAGDVATRLADELHVAVVALSARTGQGLQDVARWFAPARTLALVGSSGVGKSTLLNRLAGEELMVTREIREDDARGRHTTSHRELFKLPGGSLMLDTPGMRELGLWDAEEGIDETFAEIVELAARCRFRDCTHRQEPGCAVAAAVRAGQLAEKRVRSYLRLARELEEQPTPVKRREEDRKFGKMVRKASEQSLDRKMYRE
jgi:ribosome biogenesis GTPase